MNMIEKLEKHRIEVTSPNAAIASMREFGMFGLDATEYRFRITELTNIDAPSDDERELDYTYRYLVCGILAAGDNPDPKFLLSSAYTKAVEFIMTHQYVFAKPEVDPDAPPKLDATGKPKPKKGKKKEMAIACYNDKIRDKGLSRKDAIVILMEDVGMSSGGASTYYANLKAGRMS